MTDEERTAAAADLSLTVDALTMLFEHVEELVLCCDVDGTLRFASRAVGNLLGYDPRAVLGRNMVDFIHPDDLPAILEGLQRWTDRAGAPFGAEVRVRTVEGEWRRLRYDTVVGDALGALGTLVITLRPDLVGADERSSLRSRPLAEERVVRLASVFLDHAVDDFDKAMHGALDELAGLDSVTRSSVYLSDGNGWVVQRALWQACANAPELALPARLRVADLHLTRELAAGREVRLSMPWSHGMEMARERDLFERAGLRSLVAAPMINEDRFVGMVMLESTIGNLAFDATHSNALRSAAAIFTGAVVRHEVELRLADQARTDRVTGLGNRWAFDQALDLALTDLAVGVSPGVGLALMDLDRFKVINDSLGHAAGDRLLRDIASRLRSAADDDTVLARLGGDELLVLVDRSADVNDSEARITRLVRALDPPFDVAGQARRVTASVGLVHAGDATVGAGELLRRADVAMYRAKAQGGRTVAVDDPRSRAREGARLWREAELRVALQGSAIVPHYQGEWDLLTGELLGAEALVRWRHPRDGLLEAGAFVPMAEEVGLIDELGERVLSCACREAAAWVRARGSQRFVLRVNLAADQLRHDDLPSRVRAQLQEAGLPAEALCLELTESTLLADPVAAVARFEELRADGVGLAIDDFGTGYSSILQLKRLPVTALKIDRSFVSGLPDSDLDRAIVRATVQLADALGATVTAEGVETPEQRDALIELGCTRAQGYFLSRPEPAPAFAARLLATMGSGGGSPVR